MQRLRIIATLHKKYAKYENKYKVDKCDTFVIVPFIVVVFIFVVFGKQLKHHKKVIL